MAATVKSDVLLSTQTAGAVFRVPVIDTNLAAAISHCKKRSYKSLLSFSN